MRIEIVRPNGDLKREVWCFYLSIGYSSPCIYFDHYSFQTKETKRHKWRRQTYWTRLERRYNNIDTPPLPSDVETEMRQLFANNVRELFIAK